MYLLRLLSSTLWLAAVISSGIALCGLIWLAGLALLEQLLGESFLKVVYAAFILLILAISFLCARMQTPRSLKDAHREMRRRDF